MSVPSNAFIVRTYKELEVYGRAFAEGKFNLLLLLSDPGLGKSSMIGRLTEQANGRWFRNHATAFGLYSELYAYRDRLIVIDDVDELLSNSSTVSLLKSLCQADEVKTLSWHSRAARGKLPRRFATKSKVCLIANEFGAGNRNVKAIYSRSQIVWFQPSAAEVHRRVGDLGFFNDEEIYDWIGEHLNLIHEPDMRSYVNAKELKNAGIDWREGLMHRWELKDNQAAILRIEEEMPEASTHERAKEFQKRGLGGRATYYRQVKKLKLQHN